MLGQRSLPLHSVLLFPREKAEHQREAVPGLDPWHYLDLDYPAFTRTVDKIKYLRKLIKSLVQLASTTIIK